jgi:SAM-dependent methyltransferase
MDSDTMVSTGFTRTVTTRVDPVCDFYTEHPYPPPVANLDRARDEWRDEKRHRAEYHLLWPDRPFRSDLDILIAGCGTWQAAKYALCRPDAHVVGIDISTTSLEHTRQLARKYSLTNLETQLLPIERAGALQRRFDLIVCTGVLHHLADPDTGLRALRAALRPGGVLYLMVYAPYGRTGVYMLQDYCRRLGIGASPPELEDLEATLALLPQRHPLVSLLNGSRDGKNPSALADALLNPRDRAYSVPQLLELIDRNGLLLKRWYWQAQYSPRCGVVASTPHADRLAALSERDQYAALELWRGTITCHSAIVAGLETGSRPAIRFDHDRWRQYVPHRFSTTLCVRERVPPGAAAVLLNRSHPFHDLILAIDANESRMVDAIDGHRSIAEIVEHSGVADGLPIARQLFEKLWWYDQVVFDTSGSG